MLPANIPGAFVIQQSITLNLCTFSPLSQSADQRERSSHLPNNCGRNKARTCDLMAMNHASYQLLYPAKISAARTLIALKYHLFCQ